MIFRLIAAIFVAAPLMCNAQINYNVKDFKQYEEADFGKQLAFFAFTHKAADSLLESDAEKFEYFTKAGEVLAQSVWTNLGFEQFEKALTYTNDDLEQAKIHRVLSLLAIDHEELKIAKKHSRKAAILISTINNPKEEFKTIITEASLLTAKKEDNPYAKTNYDSLLSLKIIQILDIEEINFSDFETNVLMHQITTIRPFFDIQNLLKLIEIKLKMLPESNHFDLLHLLKANLLMQQYELDMKFVSEFIIKKITAEGGEDLTHMLGSYSKKYNAKYASSDSIVARFELAEDYRISMEIYDNFLRNENRKMVWSDLALSQAHALLKNRVYISTVTGKLDYVIGLYELMHTDNAGGGKVGAILLIAQLATQLVAEVKGMDKAAYNRMIAEREKFAKMGELYIKISQGYLLKSGKQFKPLRMNDYSSIAKTFDEGFFNNEYKSMIKYNTDSLIYYSNTPINKRSFRTFFENYLLINYDYYLYSSEPIYKNLTPYLLYDQYIDIVSSGARNEKDRFELTEDAFDIRNIAVRISLANDILGTYEFQHKVKTGESAPYLDYALYFMEKTKASSLQSELFLKDFDIKKNEGKSSNLVVSSTEELRKKIPTNTAIIQYSKDGNSMIRMTATKEFIKFNTYNLRKDSIDDLVSGFRNSIKFKIDETYKLTARRLGKRLIPHLKKSITNVVIIPDQELNQLPFEALLYKKPKKGETDFSTLPYLINRYEVSYAYSSSMYLKNRNRVVQKHNILAVAPVFAKGNTDNKYSLTTDIVRSSTMNLNAIQALPNTATEVSNIKKLAERKNYNIKVLENSEAGKADFLSSDLKKYNIIHIASHAFSDEKDYENSGILFYFEDASKPKKAILSVKEIESLELNASLVSLSACETGIGQIVKGEGVFGLGRAFFLAGAHNLLASYWKVSDASTQQLITDFYTNLLINNYSYSKALQIAKQNLIKGGVYAHPYYWSPFVLIKG